MTIIDILLPLPVNKAFSYITDLKLTVGNYVTVPFGKRCLVGVVWQLSSSATIDIDKLKTVINRLEILPIREELIRFIKWVSNYNLIPIGILLKMVIGCSLKKIDNFKCEEKPITYKMDRNLTSDQQAAANRIITNFGKYSVSLLDGETGSGKTEVYLFVIIELLKANKDAQILILLPEIALTSQLIKRIHSCFLCDQVAEWHSDLTPRNRTKNWANIVHGNVQIIVGTRSALFLPYKNLRLIVVDEEHDSSFKQEQRVIYNARDMAVVLAKIENIPIALCSATPSLETINNVQEGNYEHLQLTKRFGKAELPLVEIVDMRTCKTQGKWVSFQLYEKMQKTLADGNQIMLFLNRRGYSQLMLCKACGHRLNCPNCSTWLIEHKKQNILLCHYCLYRLTIPKACASCKGQLISYGIGIEKLSEEVLKLIPHAKIATISSDISKKAADNIIDLILKKEVDIIIGTQMIAKGYNFPNLTLVGIIDADFGLDNADLRSTEKTYQLLHQVSGRSGRFEQKGWVVMQTYNPESPIIKAMQHYRRNLFYKLELKSRYDTNMPPFSRLIALIVTDKEQIKALRSAENIVKLIPQNDNLVVFGPTPSFMSFLRGRYRYRILLKVNDKKDFKVQQNLRKWIEDCELSSSIRIVIDVDPINFM
ncbi:MAG: primosomal protein N' [Candidatus Mesenet longicola]|uniref:Replication restart protein PriA n=1 Tax=Candidatus Mesenet longicola TaxID=1892558 RepID=A0A8J3MM83_9RICK|nr:MAG: primosomal protein N' [Candidatus Mesenet longicola]GHM59674.1 MAG: primosomal protein N' [Candidatus Mesenet longicola]